MEHPEAPSQRISHEAIKIFGFRTLSEVISRYIKELYSGIALEN